MMKSSLSSSTPPNSFLHASLLLFLLYLLFFVCCVNSRRIPSSTTAAVNHHHYRRRCESFSNKTPRSLCFELQRIHHKAPLPPRMNNSNDNEIDPRYGVEKRLVPTGPNPLHN